MQTSECIPLHACAYEQVLKYTVNKEKVELFQIIAISLKLITKNNLNRFENELARSFPVGVHSLLFNRAYSL